MTDHLPECPAASPVIKGFWSCRCDMLRACEARVRDEVMNEIPAIAVYGERLRSEGYDVGHAAGMREALADFLTSIDEDDPVYLRGYAAALDAARDAVAATFIYRDCKAVALAAIDALIEPSPSTTT